MIMPQDIEAQIQDFLSGQISGRQLITFVDDAVSNGDVYEYETCVQDVVLQYQDILALYVDDPIMRSEHPAYYGPEQLKSVVVDMQRSLGNCVGTSSGEGNVR